MTFPPFEAVHQLDDPKGGLFQAHPQGNGGLIHFWAAVQLRSGTSCYTSPRRRNILMNVVFQVGYHGALLNFMPSALLGRPTTNFKSDIVPTIPNHSKFLTKALTPCKLFGGLIGNEPIPL
jgi:hypothetical protein